MLDFRVRLVGEELWEVRLETSDHSGNSIVIKFEITKVERDEFLDALRNAEFAND